MSEVLRQAFAWLLLLVLMIAPSPATADPLAEAVRVMSATPVVAGRVDVALHTETEGHWVFANRAGERFTASGPEEIKRAIASLAPPVAGLSPKLTLTVTADVVYAPSWMVATVPPDAVLRLAKDGKLYDVVRRQRAPLLVLLHPHVALAAASRESLDEGFAHLLRPMTKAHLRVIGFAAEGPDRLSSSPRIDPETKKALVDLLDPAHAASAIAGLKGGAMMLAGKVEGNILVVRGKGDVRLSLDELMRSAQVADARLIILDTAQTAQPGGRNWLWLPVDIPGLDHAAPALTLADVLSLTARNETMQATVDMSAEDRILLTLRPINLVSHFEGNRWVSTLSKAALDLIGRTAARTITVSLPLSARQTELDRRLIKSVPSVIQYGYAALLLLGLIGLPTAWRWFGRFWPQESASDYANAAGFHAARAVRATLFAVVFMPLAAIVAAPVQLLSLLMRRPA